MSCGFGRDVRLLNAAEFTAVFERAAFKLHQPGFLMLVLPSTQPSPRLGLVVAKKKVRRAHERNRFKRLVRESFRGQTTRLPSCDLVVLAKADAVLLPNQQLSDQLHWCWKQLERRLGKRLASGIPVSEPTASEPAK